MRSGQEKEEEKDMPIIVMKHSRGKMVVSKVASSKSNKGVVGYAVEDAKKEIAAGTQEGDPQERE